MKKIIIYTDGGSRGNPGKAGIGVVFCNEKDDPEGAPIKKYGEYLGDNLTNNEAEYSAVIFALKKFKALFGKKLAENSEVEIRSDSEFLVKQINAQYKILDEKIQPLFLEVWNLKLDFKSIKFKHIAREKNKEADRLVNEALDGQSRHLTLY
ncbi:MAG: Ribonuclease H [Parcubacteria group bacterium Licking1014_1]|nr:MAG: Ribonuclease H [Parcubacteria group bacterium Licking1014_1]